MNKCFPITAIIYLSMVYLINTQSSLNFDDVNDLILDRLMLVVNSTDEEVIIHCSSRIELDKLQNPLIASIDREIKSPPAFRLESEKANATTIRIRIIPNGYIGINQIICHLKNNITFGQPVDLIIGEKPGFIRLKESCKAYDHHYVLCTFRAPTIARALQNGFPQLFQFIELQSEKYYGSNPQLIEITDQNELVFKFEPLQANQIPNRVAMSINITLSRFGSEVYNFIMEPAHTTEVNFQLENISKNKVTIAINHTRSGTIEDRLCSGVVTQIHNDNKSIVVQDIPETSDRIILISRLRSSTNYSICLHCFYKQTDYSFRKQTCHSFKTEKMNTTRIFIIGLIILMGLILLLVLIIVLIKRLSGSKDSATKKDVISRKEVTLPNQSGTDSDDSHYGPEPTSCEPFLPNTGSFSNISHDSRTQPKYMSLYDEKNRPENDIMEQMADTTKVAPDTVDLSKPMNT